jgi:uncharacterized protein
MSSLDCYYEIEHGGRKYFGNVSLKPFHRFQHDGAIYVLNVATMKPYWISESVANLVDGVASTYSGGLLSEQAMVELRKLDLVANFAHASAVAQPASLEVVTPVAARARNGVSRIALFVAQQCNLSCVYCYGQSGEYTERGMMSAEMAFKAVDWLMENSGDNDEVHVGFFGGEPMMNFPIIKKVVSYARQGAEKRGKKVNFGMTTNGSLLTDERIAFLREQNMHVEVSFDGPAHIQNRQRPFRNGKGSYAKVHANVQKLIKVIPQVSAHAVLCGDVDPAEISAGIEQAGFRSFSMTRASPVILDGHAAKEVSCPDRADEREMAMVQSLAREFLQAIKERTLGDDATNSTVGFFVRQLITGEKRPYFCAIGKDMVAVTASGDIYPCHRFAGQQDMKLGNLASYKVDGMNDYHRVTVDSLPECANCWARYACGGGCFYQNKAVRGNLHLPDRAKCRKIKQLVETAISLYLKLNEEDKVYVKEFSEARTR